MNNFCTIDTLPKSNVSRNLKTNRHFLAKFGHSLPLNFSKCCANNFNCSAILVLIELQQSWVSHNWYQEHHQLGFWNLRENCGTAVQDCISFLVWRHLQGVNLIWNYQNVEEVCQFGNSESNLLPEDDVIVKSQCNTVLHCHNFDVNFKNLIGDTLDIWQKTEHAHYFEGVDNEFLKKTSDINTPRFHGQHNLAFRLSKEDTLIVELSILHSLLRCHQIPNSNESLSSRMKKLIFI